MRIDVDLAATPMPRFRRFLLAAALLAAGSRPGARAQEAPIEKLQRELDQRPELLSPRDTRIGKQVANVELAFLDGSRAHLAELMGPKGLVVLVRGSDCPVSKRYGSESARIESEYSARGFGFLFADMDEPSAPEGAREDAERFHLRSRYALDPGRVLGAELGVTRTSEAFVLDAARTLVYRGAVDDQYGRGYSLEAPRQRFLRAALDALLAGGPIEVPATSSPGCLYKPLDPAEAGTERVPTYQREIRRLLQQNCVECHREGAAGPFALDTYAAARRKAATIVDVLEQGIMPPWFAAADTGPWLNDRRLAAADVATFQRWLAAGTPEGDAADAPLARSWKDGWQIGEPDVVISMPAPFDVPAEGVVALQDFEVPEPAAEDMWVERLQILPSARQVVHHVVVHIREPGRNQDVFYGYLPGSSPCILEDGVARFVPKGSRFRFAVHYTPNGVAVRDQTRLGLVRAREAPDYRCVMKFIANENFTIPAGAADVAIRASYPLQRPVSLRALTPHMHLRGVGFRFDALLPDGTERRLLELDGWDIDWQFTYQFREEVMLPKGTVLRATGRFDNSSANVDNPDPSVDVHFGPQTTEEMMMISAEWVVPNTGYHARH